MHEEFFKLWLFVIMLGIAFSGGYYAKGTFIDAVIYMILSPMYYVLTAMTLFLAVAGVSVPLEFYFPEAFSAIANLSSGLPELVQVAVHPVTVLTVVVFIGFCHYQRINRDLPSGYIPRSRQRSDSTSLSRTIR